MPREAQLGYVAGILDGEGSISLSRSKDHKYYFSHVRIFNTDKRILEVVCEYVGGNIVIHSDMWGQSKICYRLEWNSRPKIRKMLTILLPYLVGKRERALVMIASCGDGDNKELYWKLLKMLNTKGGTG